MKNVLEREHVLVEGKDMTFTKFQSWLNETFKKESGKNFTAQDVYGYVKRGNLPYHLGFYQLKERNIPEIGIKLIQIVKLK